jgi:hypothetical protein
MNSEPNGTWMQSSLCCPTRSTQPLPTPDIFLTGNKQML